MATKTTKFGLLLENAYVVNVGGSRGSVAMELAKNFEKTMFLVQDGAMMIAGAEVPEELKGRVDFMEHELFAQQTVQADVCFFGMAFRNWDDKSAVNILKAQIPALRSGAKLLIQDACMSEPNTGRSVKNGFQGMPYCPNYFNFTIVRGKSNNHDY
jgi:hypothetical protein